LLKNFLSDNSRLKTVQIFDGLSEELATLIGLGVSHRYKKGEILFREGGIPTGIFYLESGKVKKYKSTVRGDEQIFYLCSSGELLGYHALLSEEYYPDTAATIEDSQLTFIAKDNFLKVLNGSSALSNRLLKALGHEFIVFINNITNLASKSVRERLAWNLLLLDEKFKDPENINLPSEIILSRADLANMIGTAKETLVRLLQEFKATKLIETNGKSIRILDKPGVIKAASLMGHNSRKIK
jgi:CRP-like cAMP-binding protein